MRIAVTGAASGIGSVIAGELSSLGAHVAICDKDAKRVQAFTADHENIFAMVANVSDEADVIDFFSDVEAKLGGLDALINNAGIAGPSTNLEQFDFADWQETISVNLNGAFLCSKTGDPNVTCSRRRVNYKYWIDLIFFWHPIKIRLFSNKMGTDRFNQNLGHGIRSRKHSCQCSLPWICQWPQN